MKILAVETSTSVLSLAVADGSKILAEHQSMSHKTMSDTIISKIEKLLSKAKVALSDIDGFAVGLGPGSFTSLRVGLSTVKALALVAAKPIVGVSSLDAIAAGIKQDGDICVLTDAKRSMVYASFYETENSALTIRHGYQLGTVEEFLPHLESGMILAGDGVSVFKEEIDAFLKKNKLKVTLADEKFFQPKAKALVQLSFERFNEKKFDHPAKITPLYLYPEDCQIARK